jgi:hypothetical protein
VAAITTEMTMTTIATRVRRRLSSCAATAELLPPMAGLTAGKLHPRRR